MIMHFFGGEGGIRGTSENPEFRNPIIDPFFSEDEEGNLDTVNKRCYLNLLKKTFSPALRRRGRFIDTDTIWF